MSENIYSFENKEFKHAYRHTTAHILANAVKNLYPDVKLAIGPAIENGFYYDFDTTENFTPAELEKIEAEMKKIIKEKLVIERFEMSRADALKFVKDQGEIYKEELINDLPEDEVISFYKQGDFSDLCAGPHVNTTGRIKANAFKLTSCTGAYWRGDSNNKMLQRIYGTCFTSKTELDEYLLQVEEAKQRDHNKLGRELEFFTTSEVIGQGLPILLPKGAKVIQLLQRFVEDEEERRGYMLTRTPIMAKSDLYKISGHWQKYYDGMFVLGDKIKDEEGEEVLALRPMTCPFQFQAYMNRMRSYRDLPMRYAETATLLRNESSGEMHGLIRVRQFTISEGHLMCLPEQVSDEFKGCLDLANYMLETLGLLEDVSYRFSKWDENNKDKYLGDKEVWESTQNFMREVLDSLNVPYVEADGDAAFYGPKLDIQIKNVHGKEDTLITIQIDFQLAEQFGMTYIDADSEKKHPVIIHRTSIGCYERTLALLIEKYAGAMPFWLAPTQVRVMPITDRTKEYAQEIADKLSGLGFRVDTDFRSEKIGFKIREAQVEKIPYMLVLGDKEVENKEVTVRKRAQGDIGAMTLEDFVTQIEDKQKNPCVLNQIV